MIKQSPLFFLYIIASTAYYIYFKDSNFYWQNTDSVTYLELGRILYEDQPSIDYLIYLLNSNLLGMGLIGYLSYLTMPDNSNLIFIGIFNFIIFYYIIVYCENISDNLSINLKKSFYILLILNPLLLSFSFSLNKELISILLILIFIYKILKNDYIYYYIILIILAFIVRDALGLIFLLSLIIIILKLKILYFIIFINFIAMNVINENALIAYSGNDGYSILHLNDIFIWMQNNFLYFIVIPLKFVVTILSALPLRSGFPEPENIIGYFYLINSLIIFILLFNINRLFKRKHNFNFRKIYVFLIINISIMLLPPFINQRYLIPIYPLIFILLLSKNEKNT
jgi:hypothetical protein